EGAVRFFSHLRHARPLSGLAGARSGARPPGWSTGTSLARHRDVEGDDMESVAITRPTGPVELGRPSEKLCWMLSRLFLDTPLKRFSLREKTTGHRYDSLDNYFEDRVSNVERYRELFAPFTSFREKTVMELGCSSGYLLDAFLEDEPFTAIGADIVEDVLQKGRERYGDRIRFIQTTPSSIPLPDGSVDVIYTVDTVEHLSKPAAIFRD